jgi:hypothetical protein
MMNFIVFALCTSTIAMPMMDCSNAIPNCENVECGPNQYCDVVPQTLKSCSKTVCKDIVSDFAAKPCPKVMLQCNNCDDGECVYSPEIGGNCAVPTCRKSKIPVAEATKLQKRLVCPQHFAPLCMSVECPEGLECIETKDTAFSCSKAICKPKKELVCPQYFAPLCMSHECGRNQECMETAQTATKCSKAKCITKRN